jgi:hypothetical protein
MAFARSANGSEISVNRDEHGVPPKVRRSDISISSLSSRPLRSKHEAHISSMPYKVERIVWAFGQNHAENYIIFTIPVSCKSYALVSRYN